MIRKKIIGSILGTALVLCLVAHPVSVLISGFSELKNNAEPSAQSAQSIPTASVAVQSKNKRITLLFQTKKNVPIAGSSVFLQGHVKVRGVTYPAAAAVINDQLRVTFPSAARGSRKSRQRLYTLTVSVKNNRARLTSIPVSVAHARHCSDSSHHHGVETKAVMPINEGMPSTMSHIVTLHTYADQQWLAKYGVSSQDEIVNIVNTAEAIYTRQLGIRFKVVGHNNYYTLETDPSKMLYEFQQNKATQNNDTDLKHLFTAKDVDTDTIGIAYIGVVCAYPDWAYGVTQDYYTYTPYVFAHEIGHNFGARHSASGLMTYYVGDHSSNGFSSSSLAEINSHLNYFGSCLSQETTAPNLFASKLSITYKHRIIYGKLLSKDNIPLANQKIMLYINSKRTVVVTNKLGGYSRRVWVRGSYVAHATTKLAEKRSRTIRFMVR